MGLDTVCGFIQISNIHHTNIYSYTDQSCNSRARVKTRTKCVVGETC
jgi:hypothetical protein